VATFIQKSKNITQTTSKVNDKLGQRSRANDTSGDGSIEFTSMGMMGAVGEFKPGRLPPKDFYRKYRFV
jgi:hypothetical protein